MVMKETNSMPKLNNDPDEAEEKKRLITDLILLFTTVIVVMLAIGTVAWFASNRRVQGESLAVTQKDGDFELMVRGRGGYSDEILPLDESYARVEDGETELITSSTKQSIQWLVTPEYNIGNYEEDPENTGILPGSYGKLIFWVVPKDVETLQLSFRLKLMPYRRNWNDETGEEEDPTLIAEDADDYDELYGYLRGHIHFFRYKGDDPAGEAVAEEEAKYSSHIGDSFTEDIVFSRVDGELQPYPITIYWIWPDTLGEALLKDSDLQYGKKSVCDTSGLGENEMVALFAENPEQFLYEYEAPGGVTLNQTFVKNNYTTLSLKYNEADQKIGDEIGYIVADITAAKID